MGFNGIWWDLIGLYGTSPAWHSTVRKTQSWGRHGDLKSGIQGLTWKRPWKTLRKMMTFTCWGVPHLLVGGLNPSEKYESQLGWLFPIYGKIKLMFQTTNQFMLAFPLLLVGFFLGREKCENEARWWNFKVDAHDWVKCQVDLGGITN